LCHAYRPVMTVKQIDSQGCVTLSRKAPGNFSNIVIQSKNFMDYHQAGPWANALGAGVICAAFTGFNRDIDYFGMHTFLPW
jgi:hypothetical protein